MPLRDHLEKLRYFQAVCEAGTFRRAAEQLHLSQSSLTVAVAKLEGAVGSRLLVRSKRGVRPTDAGEMVLTFARDLSFQVDDLAARLAAPPGKLAGRIRIGAYDSIAVYWLPRVLRHLRARFPNVRLAVSIGSSGQLIERVASGETDLAVVVGPPASSGLEATELFRDVFSLFAVADVAKQWTKTAAPLLISVPGARIEKGSTLVDALQERGVRVGEVLDVETFEVAKSLALQGLAAAVLPHRVAEFGNKKRLVRLKHQPHSFGEHRICIVTPKTAGDRSSLAKAIATEMLAMA